MLKNQYAQSLPTQQEELIKILTSIVKTCQIDL